jgi:hypothetical protein
MLQFLYAPQNYTIHVNLFTSLCFEPSCVAGYHLGEHRMFLGKSHPYNSDVDLPLYIRGPGLPAGTTLPHPTNHLDITATLVELAGAMAVTVLNK